MSEESNAEVGHGDRPDTESPHDADGTTEYRCYCGVMQTPVYGTECAVCGDYATEEAHD